MTLPADTRRLFAHIADRDLDLERHEEEIVERLLENGDRSDLRWLTASVPEARLASWLAARGARRLSGRSRAFWSLLLGVAPDEQPLGDELWPR